MYNDLEGVLVRIAVTVFEIHLNIVRAYMRFFGSHYKPIARVGDKRRSLREGNGWRYTLSFTTVIRDYRWQGVK